MSNTSYYRSEVQRGAFGMQSDGTASLSSGSQMRVRVDREQVQKRFRAKRFIDGLYTFAMIFFFVMMPVSLMLMFAPALIEEFFRLPFAAVSIVSVTYVIVMSLIGSAVANKFNDEEQWPLMLQRIRTSVRI